MKILVIDIAASEGGALSILKGFYNYIKHNDDINEYIFWLGDKYLEETDRIKIKTFKSVKASHIKKIFFDFFFAKKLIKKLKPDVIFSMQNIIAFGVKDIPQVLYMHQSIPFQSVKNFSFLKKDERSLAFVQYFIGMIIKMSIKRADCTIVQTNWIRDAVIKKTKISEKKIVTIFPDIEKILIPPNIAFSNKSFFYPAVADKYKNHDCIYEAAKILNERGFNEYTIYLTTSGTDTSNIVYLDKITHDEVIRNLCQSVLIFPSYIETVGLPMLEGKMVGTIILASDCPFSHEILDGYENAYFFDPFDYDELARLMIEVLQNKILHKSFKENNVFNYNSWKKVIGILQEGINAKK